MSEPFLAELRMVGFNFAPQGWAFCDGQILPINQNQSLYSLLGTTYGGDGRTSFALPDLRSRTPIHTGNSGAGPSYSLGGRAGEESHTLTAAEMPQHTHTATGISDEAENGEPLGNQFAGSRGLYHSADDLVTMDSSNLPNVGGSQTHENMQPYTVLNYCIALQGLFPSRN